MFFSARKKKEQLTVDKFAIDNTSCFETRLLKEAGVALPYSRLTPDAASQHTLVSHCLLIRDGAYAVPLFGTFTLRGMRYRLE